MQAIRYLAGILRVLGLAGWVATGLGAEPAHPEDRLFLEAAINRSPVRLSLDTGSAQPLLYLPAAQRLKLSLTEPPVAAATTPESTRCLVSEPCQLGVFGTNLPVRFNVLPKAEGDLEDMDGLLPWGLISNQVTVLAGTNIQFLARLPAEVAAWASFPLARDVPILAFELGGQPRALVAVDTGYSGGVSLNPERWAQWVRAHPGQAMTKVAGFSLGGEFVDDIQWAEHFALGGLIWHGVPVQTLSLPWMWRNYTASLGVYALSRLQVVVDGRQGRIYFRAREDTPAACFHNLLGATFRAAPGEPNALRARVAPGGPAHAAGLREGDELLAVNGLPAHAGGMDLVRRQMHGLEVDARHREPYTFTLARGTNRLEVKVALAKILGPTPGENQRVNLAVLQNQARAQNAEAQCNLGLVFLQGGYGLPADPPEAIPWLTRSAEAGYAKGQLALGTCYLNGTGVARDDAKAVHWFRQSAAQKLPEAQNALGLCYKSGQGVPEDKAEAARWFQPSAEQGLAAAQANLGACYVLGEGVPLDYAKGAFWLGKAARQNHAQAQENLGVCHILGQGVARDLVEGCKWEMLAARQGSSNAQTKVNALRGQLTSAELQRAETLAREFEQALRSPGPGE